MGSANTNQGFTERRKAPRILFETFGQAKNAGKKGECYIQNIGQGGAMVFVSSPMKEGEAITLSFEIGSKKFEKESTIKAVKELTEKRKHILKIGKSLDFTHSLSVKFSQELNINEFEYIKLNS